MSDHDVSGTWVCGLAAALAAILLSSACVIGDETAAGDEILLDGDEKADSAAGTIIARLGDTRVATGQSYSGAFRVTGVPDRLEVTGPLIELQHSGVALDVKAEYNGWDSSQVAMLVYARFPDGWKPLRFRYTRRQNELSAEAEASVVSSFTYDPATRRYEIVTWAGRWPATPISEPPGAPASFGLFTVPSRAETFTGEWKYKLRFTCGRGNC